MEATIGEAYRKLLNYGELSGDLAQYSSMFYVFSEREVPGPLEDALDDLIEALNYAEEARDPTDELVKAKNAFVSARESLDLMDRHHFQRSAIVQDIAARLQRVIETLEPGQSQTP
jgi:hypothetical protein